MIHTISNIRVRYAETDRMNVVYHSHYLVWFETARIQMLDEIGIPYREVEDEGFLIPVLSASIHYHLPARFDDRLEVHLYMRKPPRARFDFEYEVRRGTDLLATGTTSHGFMNREGRGLRPPRRFMELIESSWRHGITPPRDPAS